jgi:hypothetical protein
VIFCQNPLIHCIDVAQQCIQFVALYFFPMFHSPQLHMFQCHSLHVAQFAFSCCGVISPMFAFPPTSYV